MRSLVTGGAGFIPSFIVEELLQRGHEVIVLDDLSTGFMSNLESVADSIELVEASILDLTVLDSLAPRVDQVIHGAVLSLEESITDPMKVHEVNATGTLALLHAFKSARFVYISSSEVYGTAQQPLMNEDHPLEPHTPYAASKLAGEKYAASFATTYDTDVRIVRPFNAYGPRQRYLRFGGVVSIFAHRLLTDQPLVLSGGGTQRRDLTHAADLARGIVDVAACAALHNRPVNLGTGVAHSIKHVANELVAQLDVTADITIGEARAGDVDDLIADTTLAAETIGFTTKIDFATGVADVLEWMRSELSPPA